MILVACFNPNQPLVAVRVVRCALLVIQIYGYLV